MACPIRSISDFTCSESGTEEHLPFRDNDLAVISRAPLIVPVLILWGRRLLVSHPGSTKQILRYLSYCELHEPEPWYVPDWRIAYQIVRLAKRGEPDPWRQAFTLYFGARPEKVLADMRERERRIAEALGKWKVAA